MKYFAVIKADHRGVKYMTIYRISSNSVTQANCFMCYTPSGSFISRVKQLKVEYKMTDDFIYFDMAFAHALHETLDKLL